MNKKNEEVEIEIIFGENGGSACVHIPKEGNNIDHIVALFKLAFKEMDDSTDRLKHFKEWLDDREKDD